MEEKKRSEMWSWRLPENSQLKLTDLFFAHSLNFYFHLFWLFCMCFYIMSLATLPFDGMGWDALLCAFGKADNNVEWEGKRESSVCLIWCICVACWPIKKKVPTYIVKVCDWICLNVWWCLLRTLCCLPIVSSQVFAWLGTPDIVYGIKTNFYVDYNLMDPFLFFFACTDNINGLSIDVPFMTKDSCQ